MFSAVTSEGLLHSGQSSASDSGPRSLSAGLTAQESTWIGLLSRPTMSLLRFLPAGSRNVTDRVPDHGRDLFPLVEDVTRSDQDVARGLQWLTEGSLQELGVTTEPVPELRQLSPGDSVSGVRAAVSHLLLGCRDRPSPGTAWASGLRGGPLEFRGEMWARNGVLESEAAEPETPETSETSIPSELLSTCTPPTISNDGPPQSSPEEENLQAAPTPPQNMAIAFIMGFPCSDEDDGFDSEGSTPSSSSSSSSDDEEEEDEDSERLLQSVGLTSDPYNPRCFTASLHTGPTPVRPPAAAPQYSRDEAAERLDSGFSELPHSTKKVRFHDNVEEFICEPEDRRGQWEEFARDRLRFQRRCQEAELQLAPCLQPQHRHVVYQRLHGDPGPDFSEAPPTNGKDSL